MTRYVRKVMKFAEFADSLAGLSTCQRSLVGAIVFPLDCTAVYAIGYNGPARGLPNDSCRGDEGACGCAHAEANAVVKLDPSRARPSVLYSTMAPCEACANLIANCGVVRVVLYKSRYRSAAGLALLRRVGILTIQLKELVDAGVPERWPAGASGQ